MKSLGKKLEKIMIAATFAEVGEHEIAIEIMKDEKRDSTNRQTLTKRQKKEYRASPPQR